MAGSESNPVTALNELWEAEYARRMLLIQLGITPLVSRYDPVAAKPAQRLSVPATSDQSERSYAATTFESTEAIQAAQSQAMLHGERGAVAAAEESGTTSPASGEKEGDAVADNSEPPFDKPLSLLLVTSDDVLWIEVLEDQLLRQEQLQLIAAMARAIRGASVRCAHQQFDWPQAQGSTIKAAGGLEDMLSGFLQRLIGDHATRHVVQLGACELLPDSDLSIHQIPSSLDMLRDGSFKQSTWSILKPLRAGD